MNSEVQASAPRRGLFRLSGTRRSFVARMAFAACAVVVLTILAVGIASFQLYSGSFDREIMSFNMEVLSHFKKNFELSVLSEVKKSVDSMLTEKTQKNTLFRMLGQDAKKRDILEVYDLFQSKLPLSINLTDSVNIYSVKNETMVSSVYGVHYLALNNGEGWVRDIEWLPDFLASGKRDGWLSVRALSYDTSVPAPKNVITYVRVLAYERSEPMGFIWVNINERQLRTHLKAIAMQGGGQVMLVNAQGMIVSHADADMIHTDVSGESWFEVVSDGTTGTRMLEMDGTEMVVSAVRSDYMDMYYVYMVGAAQYYKKTAMLQRTIGILCMAVMAFGVSAWLFLSRRMARPFSQMVQHARALQVCVDHAQPGGDIGLLGSTIDTLYSRTEDLSRTLEENRSIVSATLLLNILYGHFNTEDALHARLSLSDMKLFLPFFTVINMQLDPCGAACQTPDRAEYVLIKTAEYLRAHFTGALPVTIGLSQQAVLCNTEQDTQAFCEGLVADISQFVRDEYDTRAYFGIGCTVSSLHDVPGSYEQACEAAACCVLAPQTTLFYYEQTSRRHVDEMALVEQVQSCLRDLRDGNEETLGQSLRALQSLLAHSASVANFHTVRALMADAVASVLRSLQMDACRPAGMPDPESIRTAYYLPALITALEQIGRAVGDLQRERFSDVSGRYVEQARQYMEAHYDEPIQLESMAARLYISAPYLSRIFKKTTGENFIEYLTRIRMENARRLLDQGGVAVRDVAQQVGFQDVHYFKRKYKSYFGQLPAPKRHAECAHAPNTAP